MSLRIAFLIPTLGTGGAERQLVNTVRALQAHDVEMEVFVMRKVHDLSDQLPHGVTLHVIGIRGGSDLGGFRRLFKAITAFRPDVVHGQLYPGNLISRLYRLFHPKVKVVNHIHGLGAWMKPWHILGEKLTGWLAHRILTVSKRSCDIRRKREGFSEKRLQVCYNAIDTRRFAGAPPALPPPLILGMAARLISLKRVDRVIRLVATLRSQGVDARLRIAGDGPKRPELEALAQSLGLEEVVGFLGLVTDMPAFYTSIHVLCLASETEDLPMVLIEAMAAGRVVIASDVGGVSELIEGGEGLLVHDWEDTALPGEVQRYLSELDWKAASTKNQRFAREGFDETEYARRLFRLYQRLVKVPG